MTTGCEVTVDGCRVRWTALVAAAEEYLPRPGGLEGACDFGDRVVGNAFSGRDTGDDGAGFGKSGGSGFGIGEMPGTDRLEAAGGKRVRGGAGGFFAIRPKPDLRQEDDRRNAAGSEAVGPVAERFVRSRQPDEVERRGLVGHGAA